MTREYTEAEPAREEVDRLPGATVVEFGSPYCGYCSAAQQHLAAAFEGHPGVRHLKIADGRGRRLGRSFRVKLWPTLVFLRDGVEVARVVRPGDAAPIREALAQVEAA